MVFMAVVYGLFRSLTTSATSDNLKSNVVEVHENRYGLEFVIDFLRRLNSRLE